MQFPRLIEAKDIPVRKEEPFNKPEQYPVTEIVNDEDRIVRGWISVEMKDKQGELIPIDEMKKAMNTWMKRGAPISDSHSGRIVGKGLNWKEEEHPTTKQKGIIADYQIYKDYSIDNEVWKEIKGGVRRGLSFGGRALGAPKTKKDADGKGGTTVVLSDIEAYEVASVKNPANPMALNSMVNFLAKSDGDFPMEQFHEGLKVESEHSQTLGGDPIKIARTVLDHLAEDKQYYTKLRQVEGKQIAETEKQHGPTEFPLPQPIEPDSPKDERDKQAGKETKETCPKCGVRFNNYEEAAEHTRRMHPYPEADRTNKQFTENGDKSQRIRDLKHQIAELEGPKDKNCPTCGGTGGDDKECANCKGTGTVWKQFDVFAGGEEGMSKDEISQHLFKKPLKDLSPDQKEELEDELREWQSEKMVKSMNDFCKGTRVCPRCGAKPEHWGWDALSEEKSSLQKSIETFEELMKKDHGYKKPEHAKPPADIKDMSKELINKPFAGFKDFDSCVAAQKADGKSDESAHKICGHLKATTEKSMKECPNCGGSGHTAGRWHNETDECQRCHGKGQIDNAHEFDEKGFTGPMRTAAQSWQQNAEDAERRRLKPEEEMDFEFGKTEQSVVGVKFDSEGNVVRPKPKEKSSLHKAIDTFLSKFHMQLPGAVLSPDEQSFMNSLSPSKQQKYTNAREGGMTHQQALGAMTRTSFEQDPETGVWNRQIKREADQEPLEATHEGKEPDDQNKPWRRKAMQRTGHDICPVCHVEMRIKEKHFDGEREDLLYECPKCHGQKWIHN